MNKNDQIIEWDKIEEKVHMLKDMNEEERNALIKELATCLCYDVTSSGNDSETPFLKEVIKQVSGWCRNNKMQKPERVSYVSAVWPFLYDYIPQYNPSEDGSLEQYLLKKCVDEMIESLKSVFTRNTFSLDAPKGNSGSYDSNESERTLLDTLADPNGKDPANICCSEPSGPVESFIRENTGFLEKYFSLEDRMLIELLDNIINKQDTETNDKKKKAEEKAFIRRKFNKELMETIMNLAYGKNRDKGENILLNDLGRELCSSMKTLGRENASHPDYTPVYIRSCLFRISRRMLKATEQMINSLDSQ